jgi:hypothetical protein
MSLFGGGEDDQLETADFPLNELELAEGTLAALEAAGYNTFLDIIDLEREDFLAVPSLPEGAADRLLGIIDELTVVEGDSGSAAAVAEAQPDSAEETDDGDDSEEE